MSLKDKLDGLLKSYVSEAKYAKPTPKNDDGKHMDHPDHEDDDINNDGKTNDTDSYLRNRRKAITLAVAMRKKGVNEMFESKFVTESHFKVGDKVSCIASGMEGEVIKLDEPQVGKYYTVKRDDGKTMKYAADELEMSEMYEEKRGRGRPRKVRPDGEEEKARPGSTKTYRVKFSSGGSSKVREYEGTSELDVHGRATVDAKRMDMRVDTIRLKEDADYLAEADSDMYRWSDINKAMMELGFTAKTISKLLMTKALRGKAIKEEVELTEGYEKVVLDYLEDHGVDAMFRSGDVIVDKRDVSKAKMLLKKAHEFDARDLKVIGESVELQEDAKAVADKITDYAMKHGGIDKKDMLKVASMLKSGKMDAAKKHIMSLDSDPRDALIDFTQKLYKEEVEELDELDKSTLGSYIKKAHQSKSFDAADIGRMGSRGDTSSAAYKLVKHKHLMRSKGIDRAVNRLTKENNDNVVNNFISKYIKN